MLAGCLSQSCCMSLTIFHGCWLSLAVAQVPLISYMSLTVSRGCCLSLTVTSVPRSCSISLTVSNGC